MRKRGEVGSVVVPLKLAPDEIEWIPIGDIDSATFQPASRASGPNVDKLAASFSTIEQIYPCVVIPNGRRFILVDGHRRRAAQVTRGAESLRCLVLRTNPSNAAMIWATLNRETMTVKALTWMEAWYASDGSMDGNLPRIIARDIQSCMNVFGGKNGISLLIEARVAPSIVRSVYQLRARFEECHSSIASGKRRDFVPLSHRQIGMWLVKHKGQGILRPWISSTSRSKLPLDIVRKLHTRVERDEPFLHEDLYSKKKDRT